jgi:broad specificity phosphatase PhoE
VLIYVIRHGQTAWNAERRLQGQKDIPMNATGLEQARQNGIALAGILGDTIDQFDFVASPAMMRKAMKFSPGGPAHG